MNPLEKSLTITHQLIKPLKIIGIQKNRKKIELLTNISAHFAITRHFNTTSVRIRRNSGEKFHKIF